jgi:hypothetical protein
VKNPMSCAKPFAEASIRTPRTQARSPWRTPHPTGGEDNVITSGSRRQVDDT